MGDGDHEANQHMRAVTGFAEFERSTFGDHFFAEADEASEHIAHVHQHWAATIKRQHVHTEAVLQRSEFIKLVQDHIGDCILTDFNDDAYARFVGFIADIGNAFDAFVFDEFGDLFDHFRFVHLVWNFGNDDRFFLIADLFDLGAATLNDRATACGERIINATTTEDHAAGWKIRAGDDFENFIECRMRMIDQQASRINYFAQIMGRDVGSHTDRDTACAVDQQVREHSGKYDRFLFAAVVVFLPVDGIFIDIFYELVGDFFHARFGVTHSSRRIAIHRAKVTLAIDQRNTHRKFLRHTH